MCELMRRYVGEILQSRHDTCPHVGTLQQKTTVIKDRKNRGTQYVHIGDYMVTAIDYSNCRCYTSAENRPFCLIFNNMNPMERSFWLRYNADRVKLACMLHLEG